MDKRKLKKILTLSILSITLLFAASLKRHLTRHKGFHLSKIASKHTFDAKWVSPNNPNASFARDILNQPYTYLGSGNHCYSFVSEDDKYVVKFFKQNQMETKLSYRFLPLTKSVREKIQKRAANREKYFSSYLLAHTHLPTETGIVYLHLTKTEDLLTNTVFKDQKGDEFTCDMDTFEFLIQKKAQLGYTHVESCFQEGNRAQGFDALLTLFDVVVTRAQKGMTDRDMQFFKNFGFIDGIAIEIDTGELKLAKTPSIKNEVLGVETQVNLFLQENYPEHVNEWNNRFKEYVKNLPPDHS